MIGDIDEFKSRHVYRLAFCTFSLLVPETELYSESGGFFSPATSTFPASLVHSRLNLGAARERSAQAAPCQGLVQGLFGLTMPGAAMPNPGSLPRR